MRSRTLFGVETEYAVTAIARSGAVWPAGELIHALFGCARERLVHVDSPSGGLFLANGSRMYLDIGGHPEIASPECLDPRDAVRYAKAGDRILENLAKEVQRARPFLAEIVVRKGNVDYSGTQATWGAHESYCHRGDPRPLREHLIPHLVSRVVYAGAGGFDPSSHGIEFMLSPRARFITEVYSNNSTSSRGIINTRHESLARPGYLRQHLLCGESLRSDLASWLRVGTTALVVAMVEAGARWGDAVTLDDPLGALAVIARDPGCRRTVATRSGPLTAIDIQRRYLSMAHAHRDARWMPPWAADVRARWADVLDRLEQDPEACRTSLDWAIKLAVFRQHAGRRGFEWSALPAWSAIAGRHAAARRTPAAAPPSQPDGDGGGEPGGAYHAGLERFLELRRELFEIDVRFGQLGPPSVFEALDTAGVLSHAVPGIDRVDAATERPPKSGRARLRGDAIRRADGDRARYSASWEAVVDHEAGQWLDLRNPFATQPTWRPGAPWPPSEHARQALAGRSAPPAQTPVSPARGWISNLLSRWLLAPAQSPGRRRRAAGAPCCAPRSTTGPPR